MPARSVALVACAAALMAGAATSSAADGTADKVRALIVDGQNNHAVWPKTTALMKQQLEASGRFAVDVATTPPAFTPPEKPKDATPDALKKYEADAARAAADHKAAMEKFKPDLAKYQVVVSNYNGEPWPKAFADDLDARVKDGKLGLVIVHAANNAFEGWPAYNHMLGMGWRTDPKFGKRLKYEKDKPVVVEAGKDQGSGHRYTGPFVVTLRDGEHPVTAGMPREWLHAADELYDNLRGPVEDVAVLATAYSDPAKGGTGAHEPMVWTVAHGKGRVFHTPMGHDLGAMRCIGFMTTLQRGAEWAATGAVTIPVPSDFPTATTGSSLPEK